MLPFSSFVGPATPEAAGTAGGDGAGAGEDCRRDATAEGADRIGLRVGRVLGRFKMAKHFLLEITDEGFRYTRDHESIRAEAALDGIYVIRTSIPEEQLSVEAAVAAYKSLSMVERAFRTFKGVDLQVRPIHHRLEDRVRAHIFLCMPPTTSSGTSGRNSLRCSFQDADPAAAAGQRASVIGPAQRSEAATRKVQRRRTEDGIPTQSFPSLMCNLATLSQNRVNLAGVTFDQLTAPTPMHACMGAKSGKVLCFLEVPEEPVGLQGAKCRRSAGEPIPEVIPRWSGDRAPSGITTYGQRGQNSAGVTPDLRERAKIV